MKLVIGLFVLIIAGLAGWTIYSPNPVMSDFQTAVDSGKPEAVAPFLDIPSLKKDVAQYIDLRFNHTGIAGVTISGEQIQTLTDSFVTPANMVLLMKGVKLEPGSAPPTVTEDKPPHAMEKHYESVNVYAVDIYLTQVEADDNKVSLLFHRDGAFDWKLAALRFSWPQ